MRRRTTRRTATIAAVIVTLTLGLVATVAADDNGGNRVRLQARMDGAQETQAADTDGRGRAKITLRADTNQICWDLEFSRIGTPNRGHIHISPVGVSGGIVFTFFEPLAAGDPRNDQLERGRDEGCGTPTDPNLIAAITANPSNYYVNLHNPRFPMGAIRGQLGRGGGDD